MTNPTNNQSVDLEELACRVEGLAGPDREVDALIAIAVDAMGEDGECSARELMAGSPKNTVADLAKYWPRLRRYTASLDAAMTLVPAEHAFGCGHGTDVAEIGGWAWCGPDTGPFVFAATAALALTAAALRARKETTHG